ncbi:MAG: toluene tolerance protein [Rhodocyclaceae bacterium]|jgi:hypothetical protein|nr:toluene tolerance protein [Rhodocyclaceae bacterium]MBK6908698.1 toluene tolerance protein [Rhodocyclaceae bacterium]
MKSLSDAEFLALREGAKVIEQDGHGEKVLLLVDGTFLKLFRRKRLISSAMWYPYAKRFVDNAAYLVKRGIAAPKVIALYRVPSRERDAVHYHPVPGQTLRQLFRANPVPADLADIRTQLVRFVHTLFNHGIYFRSLHLGNIVRQPDGSFGLIDISDLQHKSSPLSAYMRKRNTERMRHTCEPGEDAWLDIPSILAAPS